MGEDSSSKICRKLILEVQLSKSLRFEVYFPYSDNELINLHVYTPPLHAYNLHEPVN